MPTRSEPRTILVTEAAALVPLGPRRFRQLAGLETDAGKAALELAYENGRAVIDRVKALACIDRLRAKRRVRPLRQQHLGRFAERCPVNPKTGARLCVEDGCAAHAVGRGKLCPEHRAARAARRARRACERRTSA